MRQKAEYLFFYRFGDDLLTPIHTGGQIDTMPVMKPSALGIDIQTREFPSVGGLACAQAHLGCFAFRNSHKNAYFFGFILLKASHRASLASDIEVSGLGR